MEAVAEKKTDEVAVDEVIAEIPKKVIIPEDTDPRVVRFQNLEEKGVPLEFSAGAPISQENRNYVLKDGLCYYLCKRLRKHITNLGYPIHGNVPDPQFPDQIRSMVVGKQYRFALITVEEPEEVIVYEHLREKLNHKVLPGAMTNTAIIPDGKAKAPGLHPEEQPPSMMEVRMKELEDEKVIADKKFEKMTSDYEELSKKFEKLMKSKVPAGKDQTKNSQGK